jgi:biotin carboxylase
MARVSFSLSESALAGRHTVTEAVTGIDIVEAQLELALVAASWHSA